MAPGHLVRRPPRIGAVEGALVLAALGCVPVALLEVLHATVVIGVESLVDALTAAAVAAWVVVVVGLARLVVLHVRGHASREPGLLGWAAVRVAALVLCVAPFLEHPASGRSPSSASVGRTVLAQPVAAHTATRLVDAEATTEATIERTGTRDHRSHPPSRCRSGPLTPIPLGSGALLVPLAAGVRRRARLDTRVVLDDEDAVDVETVAALCARLAHPPARPASRVRSPRPGGWSTSPTSSSAAARRRLDDGSWQYDPAEPQREVRCLVARARRAEGTHPRAARAPWRDRSRSAGPARRRWSTTRSGSRRRLGLGRPVRSGADALLQALALREDDELVVCEAGPDVPDHPLAGRCVRVVLDAVAPLAEVGALDVAPRATGGRLERSALAPSVRELLDGVHDRPVTGAPAAAPDDRDALEDRGVVVRLLTAVPRVDGLARAARVGRERRAVELVAYLALRAGEPVTGERLRVRVLGTPSTDAAAKTLFNVASCAPARARRRRRSDPGSRPRALGPLRRRPRRRAATSRCSQAQRRRVRGAATDAEEQMAWLRAALELVESEPFATVLEGYDWFLTEGHLARLQAVCEDAACELVELAARARALALATLRARARACSWTRTPSGSQSPPRAIAAARQASFEAIAPARAQHRAVRARRRRSGATARRACLVDEVVEQLEEACERRVDEQVARQRAGDRVDLVHVELAVALEEVDARDARARGTPSRRRAAVARTSLAVAARERARAARAARRPSPRPPRTCRRSRGSRRRALRRSGRSIAESSSAG